LHTGSMLIQLKHERSGTQQQTMDRLRERVARLAGRVLYLRPTQDLPIDAETGPTAYRVSLEGADNATVVQWAGRLSQRMQQAKELRNVVSDAGASGAAAFVSIDRDSAARV